MRRLFWMAVGAGAGIYAVRKVTRAAEAYTPAGVAKGLSGLADSIRYFADEVRAGMSEREVELRAALGIGDAPETPHLTTRTEPIRTGERPG